VKVFRILKDDEHYLKFCEIEGINLGAGGKILSLPGHLKASLINCLIYDTSTFSTALEVVYYP
jgi:hypothetical protein